MKKTVLSGLCALALMSSLRSSQAYDDSPWCARFGGGSDYYENCNMRDFATCLGEIRGTGGNTVCSPNPRLRTKLPDAHTAHRHSNQRL
jgi:hypothetical protein